MKILALDTSTEACSVALVSGDNVTEFFEMAPRQQAARILVLIEKLLRKADIKLIQLEAIAFAGGPGSFTGIRLAASVAQGLALGAGLPVASVSTLAAMAQGAHREFQAENALVAVDAHSGGIYWGVYRWDQKQQAMQPAIADQRCDPSQVIVPDGLEYIGIGNGWDVYKEILNQQAPGVLQIQPAYYPHAMDIANLAISEGIYLTPEHVIPQYLHQTNTWKKLID